MVYQHNHKLKKICAAVLAAALLVTFLAHQALPALYGPWTIMEGTTFEDYDSFIAFMEMDIPEELAHGDIAYSEFQAAPQPEAYVGEPTYYDEYGNVITEEQARTRTLEDKNGAVVCRYVQRNESVVSVQYIPKDGTALPIHVYTYADLKQARDKIAIRHVIFGAVYCIETAAALLVYLKKRAK